MNTYHSVVPLLVLGQHRALLPFLVVFFVSPFLFGSLGVSL